MPSRLKYALRYSCYAIYQSDDGGWIAETESPDDDLHILSYDLPELLSAIDAIEAHAGDPTGRAPDWLQAYLDGSGETMRLPSAQKCAELAHSPVVRSIAAGFSLENLFDATELYRDEIEQVTLYHRFPSNIARQFDYNFSKNGFDSFAKLAGKYFREIESLSDLE